MPVDEPLNARIRVALGALDFTEMPMMGGTCFLLRGHMLGGARRTADDRASLMVRVGPDRREEALRRPDTEEIVMRGKPMRGYVRVFDPDDADLAHWLGLALDFNATLPDKPERKRR